MYLTTIDFSFVKNDFMPIMIKKRIFAGIV